MSGQIHGPSLVGLTFLQTFNVQNIVTVYLYFVVFHISFNSSIVYAVSPRGLLICNVFPLNIHFDYNIF